MKVMYEIQGITKVDGRLLSGVHKMGRGQTVARQHGKVHNEVSL